MFYIGKRQVSDRMAVAVYRITSILHSSLQCFSNSTWIFFRQECSCFFSLFHILLRIQVKCTTINVSNNFLLYTVFVGWLSTADMLNLKSIFKSGSSKYLMYFFLTGRSTFLADFIKLRLSVNASNSVLRDDVRCRTWKRRSYSCAAHVDGWTTKLFD